jgi:hypothetical protein
MDESRPEVMLADVVEASRAVAATRSRTAKTQALADLLTRCAPEEVGTVVSHLSGVLPQRRLGVGFRSLRDLPEPAQTPTLTVLEVDAAFERLASAHGTGSTASRRSELSTLMSRATSVEQQFLRDLMTGNLRQGALDGVVLAAISAAYAVPAATVRRAAMLAGTAAEVATLAVTGGSRALEEVSLVVGRPVRPMLAASAKTTGEAAESIGESELIVDGKLDGIRVQVHRRGGEVTRLHAQPRRDHRPRARGRRGRRGAAGWRPRRRWRGHRAAGRRQARALPGHRGANGEFGRPRRSPGPDAAHDVPLRRPPRGWSRPARRQRPGASRGAARPRAAPAGPTAADGRPRTARSSSSPTSSPPGTKVSSSRTPTARMPPGGEAAGGSRSSRCTRSTSWCSRSSGGQGGGWAVCRTSTSGRATRRPASSRWWARRSRA